jgi:hypothetical protein
MMAWSHAVALSVGNLPVNLDDYLSNGQRLLRNSSQRDAGTVWIRCLILLAMGLDAIPNNNVSWLLCSCRLQQV